jgi:enoyl-CoA hydratase/carnithine racemase
LCSESRHFSAGADFGGGQRAPGQAVDKENIYRGALRLFETRKPVIAAVQGSAIGGGLGLACSADFRVACRATRFAANFAASAPLAVQSIRHTMRGDLALRVRLVLERELGEQDRLQRTEDFREGIQAAAERRLPVFAGR